jgi:hypothetical protein
MFDSGDRAVQKWAVTRYFPTDPSRQSLQSATTEASAWFLLISITVLFVALFFHRRQAQFRGVRAGLKNLNETISGVSA